MSTTYTVLRRDGSGMWLEVGEHTAVTAERAKREAVGTDGEGTFVAVPSRSWKPTDYKTETKTRVVATPAGSVATPVAA